ncbi:MAG TPA: D-2-hydroxyacid dehydrogenase, partial [Acidimicrobiales bacterium]
MGDEMLTLLTRTAHDSFARSLDRPGVEWLVMETDGSLTGADGAGVPWPEARPDVAWGTSDLFRDGAPLAAFFRFLVDCPSLRWFQSPAAGYESEPFRLLAERGVRVCNAHVNSLPIAEFVLRAVLDEFQAAAEWRRQAETFEWRIHDWREVAGSTWLVVGLGHIGSAVSTRARALGAEVIGCRRTPSPGDPADRMVTPDRLDEVIGEADVVVLSAPAAPGGHRLVDAGFLAAMKPADVLVNVGRGSLVDEQALLAALDSGTPSAAVLDVFDTEPLPPDHPFWTHPRVRVTPHNAAGGFGRLQRQADLFGANLERWLAGRPLDY